MILRNRPDPPPAELAELYAAPNDADRWIEHKLRVDVTVNLAAYRFADRVQLIDPAAGAGRTIRELVTASTRSVITGDLAPEANVTHPGTDALTTLEAAHDAGHRHAVVILGEILEHVTDPWELLRAARSCGTGLVLSTPLDEPPGINPEHVWRWDKAGVLELLASSGWSPLDYVELSPKVPGWEHPFRIQIHTAEAAFGNVRRPEALQ